MALDAGSVYSTLGGRFNPAGFLAFDRAMKRSVVHASNAEKAHERSGRRSSLAWSAAATAAKASAVGIGVAVAGTGLAFAKSIDLAADFQQQLSSLQSVSGATARQMKALRKGALDAGAATKFSALDAAKAQTELAKGGLSVAQIMSGGLKSALALAAAGEMDLAEAAATTVNAMKLFNIDGKQSMKVADALATAANTTTGDVQDFAMALKQSGQAAKASGLSFEQTIVWLEALAEVGVKNSDAGTSMKTALTELAKISGGAATAPQAEAVKKYGLAFEDASGAMKPLPEIARMLNDKLGGLDKTTRLATLSTLVGVDGYRALLAIMDAGPKKLEAWEKGVAKQGTAAEVAAKKQDNLKGKLENLQGSLETAAIIVGTQFLPSIEKGAEGLTDWLNAMQQSGDLQRFAKDASDVFKDIAGFIGDAAPEALEFAGAIKDIADPLAGMAVDGFQTIAGAIQDVAPYAETVAEHIASIVDAVGAGSIVTGAAAFLVVSKALPIIAGAAKTLAAVQAGTSLLAMASPITIIAGAAGAAAFGLTAIADASADIGEESNNAVNALRDLRDAQRGVEGAQASATRAARDMGRAQREQRDATKAVFDAQVELGQWYEIEGPKGEHRVAGEKALAAAKDRVADATLNLEDAEQRHRDAMDDATDAMDKQKQAAQKTADQFGDLAKEAGKVERTVAGAGASAKSGKMLEEWTNRTKSAAQAGNDWADSFIKAAQSSDTLTAKQKTLMIRVAEVVRAFDEIPLEKRTEVVADTLAAGGNVQDIIDKLAALAAKKTNPKVSVDASSALPVIGNVAAALAAIQSKTVTITVLIQKIQSLLPGGGHAEGHKTKRGQAEVALIGEGAEPEYVIPTEPKYRMRGIGLLMMAAEDLGVKVVPAKAGAKFSSGAADPQAAQDAVAKAEKAVETWQDAQRDLNQAREMEGLGPVNSKRKARAISKAQAALSRLQKSGGNLPKRNAALRQARQNLAAITRFEETQAGRAQSAGTAGTEMDVAEGNNDPKAFEAARGRARGKITSELDAVNKALKAKGITAPRKRDLEERRAQLQRDLQQVNARKFNPDVAAGPEGPLTPAEEATLAHLDERAALAELTEGTADDQQVAADEVNARELILKRLQAAGAPSDAIADAARALKSARDNLSSLTDTSASNPADNPDVQAQLAQTAAQRDAASLENANLRAMFGTIAGAGDLFLVQGQSIQGAAADKQISAMTVGGMSQGGTRPTTRFGLGV